MNDRFVIGVDSSTGSCKAIVWDRDGREVSAGQSPHTVEMPFPLWHEQAADSWWEACASALRAAVRDIDASRVAALCIAHQRETFVPVDEQLHPLRPAILWMDERAGDLLPELSGRLGSDAFRQLTGKPLSGNLSAAKIAWLRQAEPDLFNSVFMYLDVQAYLVHRLTGSAVTGWGSAGPMGLYDMRRRRWSTEILEALDMEEGQLPGLRAPGEIADRVSDDAARACDLPAGIPVVIGLGDGQSSGLGCGVTAAGDAYLSLGTSVISGTFSDHYLISDRFRTMTGGVSGTYLLETVILGGTYTVDWLLAKIVCNERAWGEDGPASDQHLNEQAAALPPGSEGLLLVPYWNSAMNPYWDAKASGITVGWRGIHGRAHLYRATLEGIAFELRLQLEGVQAETRQSITQIIAAGGGAQNDLWCQIIADVTGIPVSRAPTKETAALGAGILAAAAVGLYDDIRQAAEHMSGRARQSFEPDEANRRAYGRLYEDVYRHLYPALQRYTSRLTELTAGAESG